MKKLSYWSLIVGCLFSLSEKATGQQMLTLEESVRIALAQDVSRQISDQQVRIATNNHHGSIAGKYPFVAFNLNSQGSLANQDNPASFLNGLIRSGNAVFSLDASWVVFEGFRARYNLDRLEKLEGQALIHLRTTSLETVRRVSLAYLFADWQQAQVKLAQEVLRLSNDLYNYQEQRREFGQALRQHLLQSRDAVLTDSSNLLLSQLNLQTAMISLRLAMGQPDRAPFAVGGALEDQPEFLPEATMLSKMIAQNPALQEARINREISRLQSRIRQAARYPRIALTTGAVWSGNVTALDGNNPFTGEPFGTRYGTNRNAYAGLNASFPLFDGGLRRRNVEEARLQEIIAELSEKGITNDLQSRFASLSASMQTQSSLLSLSTTQEANARESLEIAEERYKLGQMSIFDLRAVQLGFAQAAQRRLAALYNLKVTEIELLALTGDLVR